MSMRRDTPTSSATSSSSPSAVRRRRPGERSSGGTFSDDGSDTCRARAAERADTLDGLIAHAVSDLQHVRQPDERPGVPASPRRRPEGLVLGDAALKQRAPVGAKPTPLQTGAAPSPTVASPLTLGPWSLRASDPAVEEELRARVFQSFFGTHVVAHLLFVASFAPLLFYYPSVWAGYIGPLMILALLAFRLWLHRMADQKRAHSLMTLAFSVVAIVCILMLALEDDSSPAQPVPLWLAFAWYFGTSQVLAVCSMSLMPGWPLLRVGVHALDFVFEYTTDSITCERLSMPEQRALYTLAMLLGLAVDSHRLARGALPTPCTFHAVHR